jgi:hypothetical protein
MAAISAACGVNADPPRSLDVVGCPAVPGCQRDREFASQMFPSKAETGRPKDRKVLATVKVFRVTNSPISSDGAMQNPTTGPSNLKSRLSAFGQQSSQRLGFPSVGLSK